MPFNYASSFQKGFQAKSIEMSSSASSSRSSSTSYIAGKTSDGSISTIDLILPHEEHSKTRPSLRKRARQHFRSLCRQEPSRPTVLITPIATDIEFSYAVIPSALAFQDSGDAAAAIKRANAAATALIIECNDSEGHIQHTLECALQTFPKENIFVIGYTNSRPSTNDVSKTCAWFGVRYIWIPTRSKVAAQYVGVVAAYRFRFCMFTNDSYDLPPNFHVGTDWIEADELDKKVIARAPVKGIGYASEPTNLKDFQIQDLRYHSSSLPETFFNKSRGGATSFPHGMISLWNRSLLEECFHTHPGYKSSPNWFLGINLALVLQKSSMERSKQPGKVLLC